MIPRFLALTLLAIPMGAQLRLAIDLTGEWRASTDPDPGLANPDVDDSEWRVVRLPWERNDRGLTNSAVWLRKTVELPSWADRTQLALTLGTLRKKSVEVLRRRLQLGGVHSQA